MAQLFCIVEKKIAVFIVINRSCAKGGGTKSSRNHDKLLKPIGFSRKKVNRLRRFFKTYVILYWF